MRINYFHHYVRPKDNAAGPRQVIFLRDVLKAFSAFDNPEFKNGFLTEDEEHVYCLSLTNSVFMLLSTRSQEIIKAVNSKNIKATDIAARLAGNETVSFATYIYLDAEWYGLASTIRGPKNGTFIAFLNMLLAKAAGANHVIESCAIATETTREEVEVLPFVGRTTLEVAPTNALGRHIVEFLGLDRDLVSSLAVTIKPYRNRNLAGKFRRMSRAVGDEGIEKYVVKARAALEEPLIEYYLAASGHMHDDIEVTGEASIVRGLRTKAQAAVGPIERRISELKNEHLYADVGYQGLAAFGDPREWDNRFPRSEVA